MTSLFLAVSLSGCTAPSRCVQALWTCRSKSMGAGILCCKVEDRNLQCVRVFSLQASKRYIFPEQSRAMIEVTEGEGFRYLTFICNFWIDYFLQFSSFLTLNVHPLGLSLVVQRNPFPSFLRFNFFKFLLSSKFMAFPSFLRFNLKLGIPIGNSKWEIWSSKESMTCINSRPCRFWHRQRVEVVTLKRSKKFCGILRCRVTWRYRSVFFFNVFLRAGFLFF